MNSLVIAVGYSWDGGDVRNDQRWKTLKKYCMDIQKIAMTTWQRRAQNVFSDIEPGEVTISSKCDVPASKAPYRPEVRRLRASVGSFIWESIKEHIHQADILIFDLKPTSRGGRPSLNVFLELGYALPLVEAKPIFVVGTAAEIKKVDRMISDLKGLMLGIIPEDGAMTDISLRSSMIGVCMEIATRKFSNAKTE